MTIVYSSHFTEKIPDDLFEATLGILPSCQSAKIRKFRRWQDAHAALCGKLLLMNGFRQFGIFFSLEDLCFTVYGKPYLDNVSVGFNISHSGHCVLCAFSDESEEIGVDVEEVKDINIDDFKNLWTKREWENIQQGDLKTFYTYWTRKEAVIKADGRGLNIPLNSIDASTDQVCCDNAIFYTDHLNVREGHVAHLAANCPPKQLELRNVPLDSLIRSGCTNSESIRF